MDNNWQYNRDSERWDPSRQGFQFDTADSDLGADEMSVFLESKLASLGASQADVATRGGLTEPGAVFEFPEVQTLPDRVEHCSAVEATPVEQPATIGDAHASIYRPKLSKAQKRLLHAQLLAESQLCDQFERPDWPPPA